MVSPRSWVSELVGRGADATLVDLDGSYVQIIEFNRDHEH